MGLTPYQIGEREGERQPGANDLNISSEGTKKCPASGTHIDDEAKCRDVHNYYQWVPYVLVLMGLMFLLPNQLWKYLEEEKIDSIVKGIKDKKKYSI